VSEEWTRVARRYWQRAGFSDRIELHLAPASETLAKLLEAGQAGSFDFAFIDADKTSYDEYYEACLQLVRSGGLIAIDNTLWEGDVADPSIHDTDTDAIRAINRKVSDDPRVDSVLVTIGDGVMLARKRSY
jgi:predicted O-methyltransferase YrrM